MPFEPPFDPDSAPLGATPTLPPPKEQPSTERAMEVFARVLARGAKERRDRAPEPVQERVGFGGGRRYDLALSMLGAQPQSMGDDETAVMTRAQALYAEAVVLGETEPTQVQEPELPLYPPVGAPVVRPSLKEKKGVQAVPQGLLEDAADSVMLVQDPDGATSFDIAVSDTLFDELSCRITLKDKRVVATFRVRDANTRRLLEAEAGRLRVQLESRGLTVDEVRVILDEPLPGSFPLG